MHVLGTRVPRRLGVARSASSPKAAQALGSSLTPGLRISFGRVTCMARAASVPGLWALGFLLLCGVCVWVRRLGVGFVNPASPRWRLGWVCFGTVCGVVPLVSAVCGVSWLGFGVGLLIGRVWFRGRPAFPSPFPVPACGVGVCAGPGSRLCPALLGWVDRGVFFALLFFFPPVPGLVVPVPPSPFFRAGLVAVLFFFCLFRCPFSRSAAVPGLVLPVLGGWSPCASLGVLSSVPSGGGFGCLWWCWRAVWRLWAVFAPFPPPPSVFSFFLGGGGLPVPPSAFPGLVHALACIQCCLPGCCFQLRSVWSRPGPMGQVGYVHGGLGAPSCRVWSWLCRQAAAPGGCLWFWVRGLGLFVSFPLCGARFNLLGGPPPLLPGALWPREWPAVLVCGVLVRRLPGCAVARFG